VMAMAGPEWPLMRRSPLEFDLEWTAPFSPLRCSALYNEVEALEAQRPASGVRNPMRNRVVKTRRQSILIKPA